MKTDVKDATKKIISNYGFNAVLREITLLLIEEADYYDRVEPYSGGHSRRAANKVWNGLLAREGSRSDVVLKGTEVVEP